MSARNLIIAAIASEPTKIYSPLISRDSELMRAGLIALGAKIESGQDGEFWQVTPIDFSIQHSSPEPINIDVGNAGTVMRFLPPIAAITPGRFRFDGDPRSHQRPVQGIIKALEDLGVEIDHGGRYQLPLVITGKPGLCGGEVEIDASTSSQFISSLLLLAPALTSDLTIRHIGKTLPSLPHIEMTVDALRSHGVEISYHSFSQPEWKIKAAKNISGGLVTNEPDLSNAAPFLAAALLVGGSVTIKNWPEKTFQPGDQLREIFTDMGANFSRAGSDLTITATGKLSDIHGINRDLSQVGELTPIIAAVAALASTPSKITGIAHLRLHETDRISALATELRKIGAEVSENEDGLEISPVTLRKEDLRSLSPITFASYEDHRIATLGALLGLVIPGVLVEDIETTRKTITDFPALWSQLLTTEIGLL